MNHSIRQGRLPFASWQTKPGKGEPAHGYFARLVGEGYQASARVHANEMEINGRNIVLKEILNELLLLPLPEERKQSLARWTPVWDGKFHCLAGETLRKRQVSFYNRRFCRACLAEAPYHRAWWDIVDFRICPLHSVAIEHETSAGNTIKWWFPSADSAPDGEFLPRSLPRAEDPDGFEWYMLRRLGFVAGAECSVLDSAPLHEVIDTCSVVGRLVGNPWTSKTPPSDPGHCRLGFAALRGSAADVEAAFVGWLEKHVAQQERNRGVKNAYGWFRREALCSDVDNVALRAFASVGRIGRQNLKIELPHQELTIKEAAAELGADVRGLRRLAQQAGLVPKDATAASRAFLSRERVNELHAVARDLISVSEAASRLGCSQQCVRELTKGGAISGYTNTRLLGAAGHGLALRGSEIDGFAQDVRNVTCTNGAGQVYRIGYLARQIRWTDARIVEAVMAGKMSVCRIDRRRKGISAWQFEAVVHKKKPFRRQVAELEIRRIEAAELMGYQPRVVKVLVEANLIKTRKGEDGREYLDRESFNAFHAKYVNAKLYLERLGCREDQLGARLQELGIQRRHAGLPTRNEAYIVERKSMERAIGSLANADDDPPIWHQFRKELASVCPSFVLPTSMGGRDVKAYTATRVTYVELLRDGRDLIVRKTFRKAAHREWAVFVANQWQIREEWSVFTWSKKTARESVTAEFRISTDWDVEAAAVALRYLYMHFKNPRKLKKE